MRNRVSHRLDHTRSVLSSVRLARVSAVFLLASSVASAVWADVTYTEAGDAGDLPSSAQVTSSSTVTPLTAVKGILTLSDGISEGDMFEISITNAAAFSASTTGFVAGSNNFDSQLFLFKTSGIGVVANDDAEAGGSQSAIPAGSITTGTGLYYLLITGSGKYPISSGGLIFPNFTDGTTDPTGTYGPTGAGGASPITGYTGSSNEGGNYSIALTGAQAVNTPEPVSGLIALAGLAIVGPTRVRWRRIAEVVG